MENRDIDVVEWISIWKCSKLDDIVTFLRLLEFIFDDVLTHMTVGYTTLYSHREKQDISFEITNEINRLFLNMHLFSGCHKLLNRKMYWETTPDNFV